LCENVERIFYWDGLLEQPRKRVFPARLRVKGD
jgi:hypothetical protein